jgi:hypothetical protein
MKSFILAFILGASSQGLAQSLSDVQGSFPATFHIETTNGPARINVTCKVQMQILDTAEQFKYKTSEFNCAEAGSWADSQMLFKKDGVLYDRTGVAVGNLYEGGTVQFPAYASSTFNYNEKAFDKNCKVIGESKRSIQLMRSVVYAFQPTANGWKILGDVTIEKAIAKKPASSCPGAEAWGKTEDTGRFSGNLIKN